MSSKQITYSENARKALLHGVNQLAAWRVIQVGAATETEMKEKKALQNAASIAGLLLTTEALVTEVKEKENGLGAGGVGGMDDMY